jgi:hypothetical protein
MALFFSNFDVKSALYLSTNILLPGSFLVKMAVAERMFQLKACYALFRP